MFSLILYRFLAAQGKVPKVKFKCKVYLQLYGGSFRLFKKIYIWFSFHLPFPATPNPCQTFFSEVAKLMSKEIIELKAEKVLGNCRGCVDQELQ